MVCRRRKRLSPPILFVKENVAKLQPIAYDPMNHHDLVLGENVGQALHDGLTPK